MGQAVKRLIALVALVVLLRGAPVHVQSGANSDDSAPDCIRLGNAYHEVQLSKANGAILTRSDEATGADLTLGSRDGCLWGGVFDPVQDYVAGCSDSAVGPNTFTYRWGGLMRNVLLPSDLLFAGGGQGGCGPLLLPGGRFRPGSTSPPCCSGWRSWPRSTTCQIPPRC